MKILAILVVAAALLVVSAQAPACVAGQHCLYVPNVQAVGPAETPVPAPTATVAPPPIVGVIPLGTNGCELNALTPVEGAQTWIVTRPQGPFITQLLCVRQVVQGRFFYNFTAHAILHGQTQDWAFDSVNGNTGVAMVYLNGPDITPGDVVQIDVAVPYLDRVYLAHTSYVVAAQPTLTPTLTATNTPVPPTSTATNTPVPPTPTP